MIPQRIHISDVWSIHNAGDRAILEALLLQVRARWPQAQLSVAARFPETCVGLGALTVLRDPLAFDAAALQAQVAHQGGDDSTDIGRLRQAMESADLVIGTGGYFLNAAPGNPFEFVFLSRLLRYQWALDRGIPVALLGQSYGPFQGAQLTHAARSTLARIPLITARDVEGFAALHTTGIAPQCLLTADLAALLPTAPAPAVEAAMQRWGIRENSFAISVRHYAGTPRGAFAAVAALADRIIEDHGLPILLVGTTVPPAEHADVVQRERALGNDDALALAEVRDAMRHKDQVALVAEALPPQVLKGVLARCHAFLATRMHAAILATTAGTPTVGVAYEPKVRGWFDQLGLPQQVLSLQDLAGPALTASVAALLRDAPRLREYLGRVLPEVQQRAAQNFEALDMLLQALPDNAAPQAVTTDSRCSWEQESHHYDTLHTRLKKIVQSAEALPGTRLLDIGCSAGTLGAALSARWTYHGCDISASAVAEAPRGTCVACDLDIGLPAFDGEPYDVITASGILEYISAVPKLLRAARERLKPGGHLLVSYFNMHHMARREGSAFRHEHWKNNWTAAEFRALLTAAGFDIVSTQSSTRGCQTAPDVRDEGAVLAAEAATDWGALALDDTAHTLIYSCTARATAGIEPGTAGILPACVPGTAGILPACVPGTAGILPAVSVVIPAWNRLDLLKPVLRGFLAQLAAHNAELIVVDDGSEPAVSTLLPQLGNPTALKLLRHAQNQGRGAALNTGFAAASGEVVIVCDSDIVPQPDFIAEHVAFHRQNAQPRATCCGGLEWGVDSGLLGTLLGARANPRMHAATRALHWSEWYTDNWSFRRADFSAQELRFDTNYRAWGFEDLELGRRLAQGGATNTLIRGAVGHHLKPVSFEGLLSCFKRSVPNLQLLAKDAAGESCVNDWLACLRVQPAALAAGKQLLESHWSKLQELHATHNLIGHISMGSVWEGMRTMLSDAIFRVGVAEGAAQLQAARATPADTRRWLLDLGGLTAACMLVGSAVGEEEASWNWMRAQVQQLQRASGSGADFELEFLQRVAHHTNQVVGAAGA